MGLYIFFMNGTGEFPLIVCYYTQGTPYALDVQGLKESCEKWNLAYQIEPIESFGSWELNCCYKPFFLLSKLQELQRPLFWIDADAVILKKPLPLAEFSVDLAVRINASLGFDHPSKVISNSIFVNATQEAALLLKSWATICYSGLTDPARKEEYWDQVGLRDAIFASTHNAKVVNLPHAYAAIYDHPIDNKEILEPIIEHTQASRRYKKLIHS